MDPGWRPLVGSKARAVREDGAVRTYVVQLTRFGTWAALVNLDAPGVPSACTLLGAAFLAQEGAQAACLADFRACGSRWSWAQPTDLN